MMLKRVVVSLLLIFICGCQNIKMIREPLSSNEILFARNYIASFEKSELWSMDKDGKNQVRLLNLPYLIGDVSWSPDREKIAIKYSPKKGVFEIWIIEVKKKKIIKLLRKKGIISIISWSPDGKKITFGTEGAEGSIYIIDSNGENLKRITEGRCPSWSPDGKKIVFTQLLEGNRKICMMNVDGTNIERLTDNPPYIRETCPVFSSDGKWIAFQERSVIKKTIETSIVLINLELKERHKLFSLRSYSFINIRIMCFSPDGKEIALEVDDASKYKKYGFCNYEIYTIDIDGKNLKNLTNTPDWNESCPSWRPIGK